MTACADLGPVEEPGGAADDVGDAARGQRLLERLGLGVDAEQHRDLGRAARRASRSRRISAATALGLGDLVGVLGGS